MALPNQRTYQVGAVATASPSGLVTMLYDAAISAVHRAGRVLAGPHSASAIDTAHRELRRAQDIVSELELSLDHEAGGQIAAGLASLYEFCRDRLVRANLDKDPTLLPPVAAVLTDLRSAWVEATYLAEPA